MRLNDGLEGFTRSRIGLRPPKGGYSSAGRLRVAQIHHGGRVGPPPVRFEDAAATWKSYQRFHMVNRDWIDLGYNLGIDAKGRLYQGRPVGKLPAGVGNHNEGAVAICFMQDGDAHGLTDAQRATLKVLFEKGVPAWGLPPLKTLKVRGHGEFSGHESNPCPGARIMRHLKWRRGRY